MRTGVKAELHGGGIKDFWQKDNLAFGDEVVKELVGADFIGKGVVGQDGLGLGEAWLQTRDNRLRQRF